MLLIHSRARRRSWSWARPLRESSCIVWRRSAGQKEFPAECWPSGSASRVQELRVKEESADLSIGTLCHWASVLNVPITELVVEPDECLAPTHLAQSQATRLMKVAAKLRDRSRRRSIQRLAQTFVEQLAEILPALEQLARKNHRRPPRPSPTGTLRPLPTNVFMLRREPGDR